MRVAAIVLNHGNWPGVGLTLESLLEQSRPPDRVVFVDNASDSLPVDEVAAAFPDVEMVLSRRNLGYAGGMNLGISRVRSEVEAYLLVTHECLVDPDVVVGLADHLASHPDVAIVAPRLVYRSQPDTLWGAGGGLNRDTWETFRFGWGDPSAEWERRGPMAVSWVDGACWMIRASAFEEAGPLDEDFFLYYEEAAYCYRMRELGWEVVCLPGLRAAQEPSAVPYYLQVRSRLRFVARTASKRRLMSAIGSMVRQILHQMRYRRFRKPLAQAAGLFAFLLGRTGPPPRVLRRPRSSLPPPSRGQ